MGQIKLYCKMLLIISVCGCGIAYADDSSRTLPQAPQSVTLKPKMRSQSLEGSKYKFQTADLHPYLDNIIIFDSVDAYEAQPRILGFALDSAFATTDELAYVTGLTEDDETSAYTVLKQGEEFTNPPDDAYLGMQALIIGTADVVSYGDPQTIKITKMSENIEVGARLIQRTGLDLPAVIEAKPAAKGLSGYVLYVKNPTTGVGRFATMVISLGSRNGLQFGDLLNLKRQPKSFNDTTKDKDVVVDQNSFGEVLIYKVMEKVSLGFIVSTTSPVVVGDQVSSD